MLQRVCLALTICALVFVCAVQTTQAGWRDTGLTRAHDASSLVISIKKHKHHDGDDNGDNHKHKKKKGDDQSDESEAQPDKTTTQGQASTPRPQNDQSTPGDVPAATLLLPGFETDLNNPGKCKGATCPN